MFALRALTRALHAGDGGASVESGQAGRGYSLGTRQATGRPSREGPTASRWLGARGPSRLAGRPLQRPHRSTAEGKALGLGLPGSTLCIPI
ncbi:hypothetical protein GGTG_09631 [Gaeumannomyces tritici R3-111a-1]|uniref:Uncharacterized protein n=1 Tax=Gaeumannomyces tritici (strain R3-111a-1) TaxID=644352 RepID=J3P7Z3_GAET3|nr:hypothetical protein GGTG_09631 [Gaeumannomyces tritici R3-111a-1]EJT72776.1 hypothetical protein GGTG_09631 [Gaeumannomyces tritici R3-111a-1]